MPAADQNIQDWRYFRLWIIHPDGKRVLLHHWGVNLAVHPTACAEEHKRVWQTGLKLLGFNPDDFKFEIEETSECPLP